MVEEKDGRREKRCKGELRKRRRVGRKERTEVRKKMKKGINARGKNIRGRKREREREQKSKEEGDTEREKKTSQKRNEKREREREKVVHCHIRS